MKALLRSIAIAALAGAGLTLLNPAAAETAAAAGSHVADEVLVKFKPVFAAQNRTAAVAARGHSVLANLHQPGWVRVRFDARQTMAQALAAYRNDPDVEYAQPNYIYRATAAPNDTQYGQLWALKNFGQAIGTATYTPASGTPGADINVEKAWDLITDCSSVVVAVVDTGVNYTHEDLAGNMWNGGPGFPNHGTDFVSNDNDPMDLNGHGTHVAGIIGAAGNNGTGTTGVCWKASIMAVRVLNAAGSGTTASVIQGVGFAVSQGAKVINMSLAGGGAFDQAFSGAITNARANDVAVVVAAGNEANNNDAGGARYPCNFTHSNLTCVAALDQNYALASFSNWGAASVDVGAPGTNILSMWIGGTSTYNTISGTSMASAEVAGLAAMLRAYNPRFTFADVVNAIRKGGRAAASLAGKTVSGNSIDVMSSLAFINPPAGLTAAVQ
jgi:subtilisin family serine protease